MEIPWNLFRKAALVLFVAALLTGFGATALFLGGHLSREPWRIVFILALVVLTITSTILIPRVLIPNLQSPHPEFLTDDLDDEWRDLQQHRIARPHILLVSGALAALAYLWAILYYGKLTNAIWFGWLPVGAAAIALALLLIAIVRRTPWYNNRAIRTPTRVILIAFAGFTAALLLGIVMTEQVVAPPGDQALRIAGANADYGYVGSRAWYLTRQYLDVGPVPDIDVPDCDGDECGYLFLVILFVVLTLILVAGAALVPHMWVLSGLVLLTLIALLALHEIRRNRDLERQFG